MSPDVEPRVPEPIDWALRDLLEAIDVHPLVAGLILELPYWAARGGPSSDREMRAGGRKPEWSAQRRDEWVRCLCATLDLLYHVVPDQDGTTLPLVDALEAEPERERLGLPSPDAARERIRAGLLTQGRSAAVVLSLYADLLRHFTAVLRERDELRADRSEYAQDVDPDAGEEEPDEADESAPPAGYSIEFDHDEVGRAVSARLVQEEAAGSGDEYSEEYSEPHIPRPELERLTSPSLQGEETSGPTVTLAGGLVVPAVPCRVDDCDQLAPARAAVWSGICRDDRELLSGGGTVLIGGLEHRYDGFPRRVIQAAKEQA